MRFILIALFAIFLFSAFSRAPTPPMASSSALTDTELVSADVTGPQASMPAPGVLSGPATDQAGAFAWIVTAQSLNLRSQPSTGGPVIGKAKRGTRLTVLATSPDGWARINLDGRAAYASARYLQPATTHQATLLARSSPPAPAAAPGPSRAQAVTSIIRQSREAYAGSCACPDDRDRAGRRCGGRSAYSRRGGARPLCYPQDVTEDDLLAFSRANGYRLD